MSENNRSLLACLRGWPGTIRVWLAGRVRCGRQALYHLRNPVPVEVLIVDRDKRRALEGELRRGLRRLGGAVGTPLPTHAAVVVQQILKTDRQLAGCYQLWQRPDGARCALFRLALQVNGQHFSPDELLAALAEQWIGLAIEQSGTPSVLVPVELDPARPPETKRLAALRPDPLAPHPNGTRASEQAA
ncbi:MAG: hypothetical protein M0Z94_01600 [Dehalococcoidales bacterium]|nr:hypothetical protein [Dehalococcoidales bacterium]